MPIKDPVKRKEYNRKYQKKHYEKKKWYYQAKAKERQAFIHRFVDRIRRGVMCGVCGERRWWVLDFHHRNPAEKEYNIPTMIRMGLGINRIKDEIRKCDVLCSNCHRDLHHRLKIAGNSSENDVS